MDTASRCALPGCTALLAPAEPDRPARKYCSPEHRAAARHIPASSAATDRPRERATAALHPLTGIPSTSSTPFDVGRHATGPRSGSRVSPEALAAFRNQIDPPPRRRRQLVAVLGVTGILAAGGGWIASDHPAATPPAAAVTPYTVESAEWSTRANIVLASITRQLEVETQTETTWNNSISSRYQGRGTPAPVVAMLQRKALLEQQKAALMSQLSTMAQVKQATDALAVIDGQIAQVKQALDAPTGAAPSPDQLSAIAALKAQAALLQQTRDAKAAELDRLQHGVVAAQGAPLPDASDRTTPVSNTVLALGQPGKPNPNPSTPTTDQPPVLASGRENRGDRAQQQFTTGEPGHDPENVPRHSGPLPERRGRSQAGPVGSTVNAVGDAAGRVVGDVADALTGNGADKPGKKANNPSGKHGEDRSAADTKNPVTGAVESIGATGDGVVGGLTDTVTVTSPGRGSLAAAPRSARPGAQDESGTGSNARTRSRVAPAAVAEPSGMSAQRTALSPREVEVVAAALDSVPGGVTARKAMAMTGATASNPEPTSSSTGETSSGSGTRSGSGGSGYTAPAQRSTHATTTKAGSTDGWTSNTTQWGSSWTSSSSPTAASGSTGSSERTGSSSSRQTSGSGGGGQDTGSDGSGGSGGSGSPGSMTTTSTQHGSSDSSTTSSAGSDSSAGSSSDSSAGS